MNSMLDFCYKQSAQSCDVTVLHCLSEGKQGASYQLHINCIPINAIMECKKYNAIMECKSICLGQHMTTIMMVWSESS